MRARLAAAAPAPLRKGVGLTIDASRRVGYARARMRAPIGTRPPIYLAVCAVFRDEARYLAEWVTFHRLRGVERFWLYDNQSADDWRGELAPELASGVVTVTPWTMDPPQHSAYADCLTRHRDEARWVAFLDIDEFLFSPSGIKLPELLRRFDAHPGVVANWRAYGTSGHMEPPDGLVTESYVMRVADDVPVNRHVKSIVYPRKTSPRVENPHIFRQYGAPVGEDGQPVMSPFREPPTAELLRINHYWSRSLAELRRKYAQPRADQGTERVTALKSFGDAFTQVDGVQVLRDDIRDEAILRFLPQLREELASRRAE